MLRAPRHLALKKGNLMVFSKTRLMVLVVSGAALAGCTGSTDPTEATVFDNIRNINSGEYDRQIAAKEAEADAIVAANEARQRNISSLEGQRAANAETIAALRAEIAQLQAEAAAVRASAGSDAATIQQIDRIDTQLVAVRNDVDAGADPAVVRNELGRIRSAIRALSS